MTIRPLRIASLLVLLLATPASARIFYVDAAPCATRDGTSPTCANGHGPFVDLGGCNSNLGTQSPYAPDECRVAAGTYTTQIKPQKDGCFGEVAGTNCATITTNGRLRYYCPTATCTLSNSSASIDLTGRDYIEVDGFAATTQALLGNSASTGNYLHHFTTTNIIQTSCTTDTLIEDVSAIMGVSSGATIIALASGCAGQFETRTTLRRAVVRGASNTFISSSPLNDSVIDGLDISESQNHLLTVHGATNLTIKNSILGPGAHFGEHLDLRSVNGLNLLNNVIYYGMNPSGSNTPNGLPWSTATGNWVVRSNVFLRYTLGRDGMVDLNDSQHDGANTATYDFNNNAYIGLDAFELYDRNIWSDSRGAVDLQYGPTSGGLTAWRARIGGDADSNFYTNEDYKATAETWNDTFFDTSAASWGGVLGPASCGHTTTDLYLESAWGGTVAGDPDFIAGQYVEVGRDGVTRTIATGGVTDVSATKGSLCQWKVVLDQALSGTPAGGTWIRSWGETDPGTITEAKRRGFIPVATSPLHDAGDVDTCAHPFSGAQCDIGPKEYPDTTSFLTIIPWYDVAANAGGIVTDELLQIECGLAGGGGAKNNCDEYMTGSITIEFTDHPAGLTFNRWTGDCESCGSASQCTLDMTTGPKTCSVVMGIAATTEETAAAQVPFIPRPPP